MTDVLTTFLFYGVLAAIAWWGAPYLGMQIVRWWSARVRARLRAQIDDARRESLMYARLQPEPTTYTCPRCDMTSHNPFDRRHGYCGYCHDFTGREENDRA